MTSGQPSLNPRLVKEADTLINLGFEVVVLYQYWNEWGTQNDITLLKEKKWRAIRVGGSPKENKMLYWSQKIIHKVNAKMAQLSFSMGIAERHLNKNWYLFYKVALRQKPDLIIGHNLGALPVVVKTAEKLDIKCGFDAEDFHRFEESDNITHLNVRAKIYLENKYFRQLDYITTASPLITECYQQAYPDLTFETILNVFQKKNVYAPKKSSDNLKLFWFSQTVGRNRGLENIISALSALPFNVTLTLLGQLSQKDKQYFISIARNNAIDVKRILFMPPVEHNEIFRVANKHDIGLALEINTPMNRDICLTNKFFSYLSGGIAIVASSTQAQSNFLINHPNVGICFSSTEENSLANVLHFFNQNRERLKKAKIEANRLARTTYNWETESIKFSNIISKLISN